MSLDKNQVKLIESDVESARITLTHLSEELVDHICCEVERYMKEGKSFNEAYALVREQTGIEVLQKIQENTLYLINKKYAIMKTIMKVAGNVSLALLGVGTLSKLMHMPGANELLVLGFALFCLIFFPMVIYFNYTDEKVQDKLWLNLSILTGGVSFMAGILLKVMHWPAANAFLLAGWALILVIFLPLLMWVKLREPISTKEKAIYVIGAVGVFIFEMASMFKFFHWENAQTLMVIGSVILISIFLPLFAYMRFRQSGKITGEFIYMIIISMYAIALSALISVNMPSPDMKDASGNTIHLDEDTFIPSVYKR